MSSSAVPVSPASVSMSGAPAPRFSLRISGFRKNSSDATDSTENSSHWIQLAAAKSGRRQQRDNHAATPKKMM